MDFILLLLVLAWTLGATAYLVLRDRRHRIERRVLADVLDGTRAELERAHAQWRRAEKDRGRIYRAIGTFQRAHPALANEFARILRTTPASPESN